jgi:O-antigen ligase
LDSFSIIYNHLLLGVGTDGFQYHSFGSYPHNIFLELLTNYGIAGLILTLYLMVILLFISLKTWSKGNRNLLLKIIASIFIFFFTETMFSFTLWMHKGLYLSMALYSVYYHYDKKERFRNDQS